MAHTTGTFQYSTLERLGALVRASDSTFLSIMGVSTALHVVLVCSALAQPVPPPMTIEQMVDRFPSAYTIQVPVVVKPEATPTPSPEGEKSSEKSAEKLPEKAPVAKKPKLDANPIQVASIPKQQRKPFDLLIALKSRSESLDTILGPRGVSLDLETLARAGGQPSSGGIASTGGLKGQGGADTLVGLEDTGRANAEGSVQIAKLPRAQRPQVAPEAPIVTGSADAGNVELVFKRNMGAITGCYENALKNSPHFHGKVAITLAINAEGRVEDVSLKLSSQGESADFSECVRERVQRWKFARLEGDGAEVTFNVIMTPKG